MNKDSIISCTGLDKSYFIGKRKVEVLKNVSLEIAQGECLAIMGASGAGKSTLLHVLGALDTPEKGTVRLADEDVYRLSTERRSRLRANHIGFIFQAFYLLPELDITENVGLPQLARGNKGLKGKALREKSQQLLQEVGLGHRMDHRPMELSGGEQQRVAIARALINDPKVIFADEPTGNLDSKTGQNVLDTLMELGRKGDSTLVMVTHNQAIASQCDRVLHLIDGLLEAQ